MPSNKLSSNIKSKIISEITYFSFLIFLFRSFNGTLSSPMESSDTVFFADSLLSELFASSLVALSLISLSDCDPHLIVSLVNFANKSYNKC